MTAQRNPFAGIITTGDSRILNIVEWRLRGLSEREITNQVRCNAAPMHRTVADYGMNGAWWFEGQKVLLRNAEFEGRLGSGDRILQSAPDIDNAVAVYTVKVKKS